MARLLIFWVRRGAHFLSSAGREYNAKAGDCVQPKPAGGNYHCHLTVSAKKSRNHRFRLLNPCGSIPLIFRL